MRCKLGGLPPSLPPSLRRRPRSRFLIHPYRRAKRDRDGTDRGFPHTLVSLCTHVDSRNAGVFFKLKRNNTALSHDDFLERLSDGLTQVSASQTRAPVYANIDAPQPREKGRGGGRGWGERAKRNLILLFSPPLFNATLFAGRKGKKRNDAGSEGR